MSLYSRVIGALSVVNAQQQLNNDLKDYNEILHFHLDKIYSHPNMLKFKFLGGTPEDEEVKSLAMVELASIVKNRRNYEIQDNIYAARKKFIYQSIEPIFQQLCK